MPSETIAVKRELLKSEAFRKLSGTAKTVFFDFLMRCQVKQSKGGKPGRRKEWVILNNGELEYPYAEAEHKKPPIQRSTFMRTLDTLIERGFIDVTKPGSGGKKGDKSTYAISDRWRNWGTDKFVEATRPKDTRQGRGFAVYWTKQKTNIGIKNSNPTITENSNPKKVKRLMDYQKR